MSQSVGVPHEALGEMIVACVVPVERYSSEETKLRDLLKEQLAICKVPRKVIFVALDELSFTGSEKVRTAALREFAAKRLTDGDGI